MVFAIQDILKMYHFSRFQNVYDTFLLFTIAILISILVHWYTTNSFHEMFVHRVQI